MEKQTYHFTNASVDYYFNSDFGNLNEIVQKESTIIITDQNVYDAHASKFIGWKTIIIKAGEQFKNQETVNDIIGRLFAFEADRNTTLVGVGGGVVTDITGFVASIYMRGIKFGFVPTTLLAMVDASIGGKNGIDVGLLKNMIGIIRQPSFLLYDISLLTTLPEADWSNGFAEIIKHACIKDARMFDELKTKQLSYYQSNQSALAHLVKQNVLIKTKVVQEDEFEKADRKLLNFGHTLGHAIENNYQLMHGQAVAIGMVYAAKISEKYTYFNQTTTLIEVIQQYGLPVSGNFDLPKAMEQLKMDKKRVSNSINYVLLKQIGEAIYQAIPLNEIDQILSTL